MKIHAVYEVRSPEARTKAPWYRGARPRFTVITVCYNDLENLKRTEASLARQSFRSFEWIVVDGASTDGTAAYLETLDYPYLTWQSEPDKGLYDAMNKGARRASGEFFLFLNAGDTLDVEDTLARTHRFIERHPDFHLYYGDTFEESEAGELFLKRARPAHWIWYNLFAQHQSIFYAAECFERFEYPDEYRISSDFILTFQVLDAGYQACKMPFVISHFLQGGVSQRRFFLGKREDFRFRRRMAGKPLLESAAIWAVQSAVWLGKATMPGVYKALRFQRG